MEKLGWLVRLVILVIISSVTRWEFNQSSLPQHSHTQKHKHTHLHVVYSCFVRFFSGVLVKIVISSAGCNRGVVKILILVMDRE